MTTSVGKQRGASPDSAHSEKFQASNPLISDARLRHMYSIMLQSSVLRERLPRLTGSTKSIAKYAHSFGEEAAVVDAAIELRRGDWLAPAPESAVAALRSRASLAEIVPGLQAHAAGRDIGAKSRKDLTPNILPPPVTPSAQLSAASGVALALKASGKHGVVVALCGAASTTGKSWQDALTFAGAHCLPLVVLVQVKAVDVASTRHKATSTNLLSDGQACGFPVIPVDAHDAVAMYRVAHESIHKARNGGGPTLIEATDFRALERHARAAKAPDAISRMEDYLTAKGSFSPDWKGKLVEKFNRDFDAAIETAQHALSRKRT